MANLVCLGGPFNEKVKEVNDELLYSKAIVTFVRYVDEYEAIADVMAAKYYEYEVFLIISPSGTKHYVCVYTGEEDENL